MSRAGKVRRTGGLNEKVVDAAVVVAALERRYPKREYATFFEVRAHTGFGDARGTRTADAMALSLWPSRGLTLTGFEIKTYRGDWRREKETPEKAERIAQYCDYWCIAASHSKVVPIDQVPDTWGLLVLNDACTDLVVVKEASRLKPASLDRPFVAALLRNISDTMVPKVTVEKKVEEAYRSGQQHAETHNPDAVELEQLRRRDAAIKRFETAAGMHIDGWEQRAEEVGAAARHVLNVQQQLRANLANVRGQVQRAITSLDHLGATGAVARLCEMLAAVDRELVAAESTGKELDKVI